MPQKSEKLYQQEDKLAQLVNILRPPPGAADHLIHFFDIGNRFMKFYRKLSEISPR